MDWPTLIQIEDREMFVAQHQEIHYDRTAVFMKIEFQRGNKKFKK